VKLDSAINETVGDDTVLIDEKKLIHDLEGQIKAIGGDKVTPSFLNRHEPVNMVALALKHIIHRLKNGHYTPQEVPE
jgi:hypothetical protein